MVDGFAMIPKLAVCLGRASSGASSDGRKLAVGVLADWAPIPGANGPSARLAYPLHGQHLVQPWQNLPSRGSHT
jgi:hypothetical protein